MLGFTVYMYIPWFIVVGALLCSLLIACYRVDGFKCRLIGHEPRGPINKNPVVYMCDRCQHPIYFDRDRGWLVVEDE